MRNLVSISKMFMTTMLVFVACISFCSCGKNSNNSAIDEGDEDLVSFVGTWTVTSKEWWRIENGHKDSRTDDAIGSKIIFSADGDGLVADADKSLSFSWRQSYFFKELLLLDIWHFSP